MKRRRGNENPGPSRVNRPTRSINDDRGEAVPTSQPSAPVTSSSRSRSTTPTRGEVPGRTSDPSRLAMSVSAAPADARGPEAEMLLLRIKYEALAYVQLVKDTFKDDKDKSREFLELMKNYWERTMELPRVITRVKELFKGHPKLLLGLNAFLPKRYEIVLSDKEDSS